MLITKLNLQLTILLRNNLTMRLRSICVPNALHLRSERAPFAFRTRSICVPNALHLRSERAPFVFRTRSICVLNALHLCSERVPFTFRTHSKMHSKAFQCIPAKNVSKTYMLHLKERFISVVLLKMFHNYKSISHI